MRLPSTRLLLGLAAVLVAGGCAPPVGDNAALEGRLAELEERLGRLEERLASVPDSEGLSEASLDELVHRLRSDDVVSRYRAVKELSRREPEQTQELLLEVIANGTGKEREGAAAVFALDARPGAVPGLLPLHAQENEPRVRALLSLALGRSGGSEVAEALMADLSHESRTVRLAAVQALDRLGAAQAGGRLLRAAMDPDVHVASAARGTLQRLPESCFQFIAAEWDWLDPRQRERAIDIIGTLSGARSTSFLRQRIGDPEPLVALAAARELALRGDSTGRDLALQRLRSEDPAIARAARLVLDASRTEP